jgi:hypothetical protein
MANDSFSFFCPACGIKLTVPRALAGVVGPCPSCGNQIQAPFPFPTPSPSGMQAGSAVTPAQPSAATSPAALKPEPRQLPNRAVSGEVIARPMPEPIDSKERRRVSAGPLKHRPFFRILTRFLMFVLFLIAAIALVYGVLTVLKRQPPAAESPQSAKSDAPREPVNAPQNPKSNALPTPSPELAPVNEAPQLPDGLEPISPWKDAEAVLEKFLAAKNLAERLPLIETKTAGEELAASCLAAPLPIARKMVPEFRETNPIEKVVDCYYTVEFETKNNPAQAQTILVRTRGNTAPKVVADPFLDTFGGRLAAYAAAPVDKAAVFQVVVYAVASCTDPGIPNREKKLTLKLLACDNTKEIARAYFGRQSKIGEMLENGTYSLSYGNAKACTVMLRWNTEDNPEHPFLEAIDIKDLDWNS